eukprot:1700673-Amphidinium_carterae.1
MSRQQVLVQIIAFSQDFPKRYEVLLHHTDLEGSQIRKWQMSENDLPPVRMPENTMQTKVILLTNRRSRMCENNKGDLV